MTTIALNLQAVHRRIEHAARESGRSTSAVGLVAVSKTVAASYIEEALRAGHRTFGESYVQEAVKKITALGPESPEWHFIGPIQSNKTRAIAEHFQWVHAVDRDRIAARLSEGRPRELPPLNVCIQVNVSGEASKSGVEPGRERALAEAISALPRLRLRGLMAIPEPTDDIGLQRKRYARLRQLKDALCAAGYPLDTLSMGMSEDLEAAIAEGATLVRVGTAIFGARERI